MGHLPVCSSAWQHRRAIHERNKPLGIRSHAPKLMIKPRFRISPDHQRAGLRFDTFCTRAMTLGLPSITEQTPHCNASSGPLAMKSQCTAWGVSIVIFQKLPRWSWPWESQSTRTREISIRSFGMSDLQSGSVCSEPESRRRRCLAETHVYLHNLVVWCEAHQIRIVHQLSGDKMFG